MSEGSPDLKAFALLAELADEDRAAIASQLVAVEVRRGRRLYRAGAEADGLLLLVAGDVDLESPRGDHKTRVGPGTALGAASLVAVGKREISARAASPCRLLFLERTRFHRLSEDEPRAACRLLEAVLRELAADARATLDELAPAGER